MHLCRSRIAYGLLAVFAGCLSVQAAVVYKWTDADGVVHFSDQPAPGAEKLTTFSGSSRGVALGAQARTPASEKPKAGPLDFRQLAITSPGHDETITGNQPVSVQLAVDPALNKETQAITWYLNGSALTDQPADATQFTLADLPRGTYTLSATVVDQPSGQTKSADSVTFYVQRTTLLSPTHKGTP